MKNRKLACFKRINTYQIDINYIQNKYTCNIKFLYPDLYVSFNFNDLSFLENNNGLLVSARRMTLSNILPKTLDNYNSLQYISLNNINIENINVISTIYKVNKIKSRNIKCNSNLIDSLENFYFEKRIYCNKIKYRKYKSWHSIFEFDITINKDMLINIKSLKNSIDINLNNLQLTENELLFLNKDCFSSVTDLNLSNTGLKNLNFISFNSLSKLRYLNISKNSIEDISYLNENNIKCKNIVNLYLNDNPIRKGLEVLKQNFFVNRIIFVEIRDIIKDNNDEYKISLNLKNHINHCYFSDLYENNNKNVQIIGFNGCSVDIYIKDLNDLWNFVDIKKTFFGGSLSFEKVKNLNITEEEFNTKKNILKLLLSFSYQTNEKDRNKFKENIFYGSDYEDNIKMNVFLLLHEKGYNYLKVLNTMDKIAFFEKITKFFSFLNISSLCYFENLKNLNSIDLTGYKINDIKVICGDVPFTNLEVLRICKNSGIINLNELKNAKFKDLKELYLIEDGIEDLSEIELDKYPFKDLKILDLSKNKIVNIEPILNYINLKKLKLRGNKVFIDGACLLVEKMKCEIDLRGNYVKFDEVKNKCPEVISYQEVFDKKIDVEGCVLLC